MTIRRSLAAQGLVLAATLLFSFALAFRMPGTVVTHWNAAGQADGWGSKWTILLLMPCVLAFDLALTVVLPAISPREARIERFGPVYGLIMFVIAAMMGSLHVAIVLKSAGTDFDVVRAIMAVTFAAWIPLGNVIGKVRRNYSMGVRTPWTLSSDRVWHATHRAAGRLWVGGGVAGLLATLGGVSPMALVGYLLVLCLLPVAQSYIIYRRLEG